MEALEGQKRDSWHNTNFKDAPPLQNHIKERLDLDMPLKPHTYLFNVLIQLLIWIDLPHQVLQLLFTENLGRKQMHPFFIDASCGEPELTTEPPQDVLKFDKTATCYLFVH